MLLYENVLYKMLLIPLITEKIICNRLIFCKTFKSFYVEIKLNINRENCLSTIISHHELQFMFNGIEP